MYERLSCDGCGQPLTESLDPDREGWYIVEPIICAGCAALHRQAARDKDEPGLRYRVVADPGYIKRS